MLANRLKLQDLLVLALLAGSSVSSIGGTETPQLYPRPNYETPEYWSSEANQSMDRAIRSLSQLRYTAKNVILFIGDGMGISTVTAGRILKGQLRNASGEETSLAFDEFDHAGLIRTYNADRQTPDSASTATAFLCGVKTNQYTLGVNQNARLGSCSTYDSAQHDVASFLKLASEEGRSTGVVTTSEVTGATPAPAFASSVSRDWQDDTDREEDDSSPDTPEQRRACVDIATQMVHRGVNFTVLMGAGRLKLLPRNVTTMDQFAGVQVNGTRSDGVNLVETWKRLQSQFGRQAAYIETADELKNLQANSVDNVLGLFATKKMQHHVTNIRSSGYREPSLADMTRKSLEVLAKNPKGFALLVEGARIDSGHHANQAQRALYDVVAFDEAVEAAVQMTSREDTLIVVSADHSHVFTIGHYGYRGQPILGNVIQKAADGSLVYEKAPDGIEKTVATYSDGPSAVANQPRPNINADKPEDRENYRYPSFVPRHSGSHAAEDVSVHAIGPGAHLFQTVHQQTYIAHVIMKSACLGWYRQTGNCLKAPDARETTTAGGPPTTTTKAAPYLRISKILLIFTILLCLR